jgi:hypothetical protein
LGRADRAHISGGSAADHDEIVCHIPPSWGISGRD